MKNPIETLYNFNILYHSAILHGNGKEVNEMGKRRKRRSSIFVRMITLSFIICAMVSFIKAQSEVEAKRRELIALEESIQLQQMENDEIRRVLDGGTDLEYIERVAREKLGYAYPDEKIFIDRSGS